MTNNSELSPLTPHEASEQVGVGVQSIRRWCEWHASHLSPGANPGQGMPRRLEGRDIEVLRVVKDLRFQGLQTEAINEQLKGTVFPVVDREAIVTVENVSAPPAMQERQGEALLLTQVLEAMTAQDKKVDVRLRDIEARRQATTMAFLLGLTAGLVLAFSLLAIAIWIWR